MTATIQPFSCILFSLIVLSTSVVSGPFSSLPRYLLSVSSALLCSYPMHNLWPNSACLSSHFIHRRPLHFLRPPRPSISKVSACSRLWASLICSGAGGRRLESILRHFIQLFLSHSRDPGCVRCCSSADNYLHRSGSTLQRKIICQ